MRAAAKIGLSLLLGLATLHPAVAERTPEAQLALDTLILPAGSEHVVSLLHCRWFGLPLAARGFDAPGPVSSVIGQLRGAQPAFRDVRAQSNEVVLSGTQDRQQWIARLTPLAGGRVGVLVSTLRLPAVAPMTRVPANASWMPRDARLRFDLATEDGRSVQQIWTHGLAPSALYPMLHKALRVRGWETAAASAKADGDAPSAWSRKDANLDLSVLPADGGSAIVIRRRMNTSERS